MEHNIGVGVIVGLTFASSVFVWSSDNFNKVQKTVLLICAIFPPAQWLGILIVLIYNNFRSNNTVEKIQERKTEETNTKLNSSISDLKELKQKGLISEQEYKTKVERIEAEKEEQNLKNSTEYKQLKSLFENGVLTKEEFESKVELLKNQLYKEKIVNKDFKILKGLSEDYFLIINDNLKYGFVDKDKNIRISPKFEYASSFKEGVALVQLNGRFGFIDKQGNIVINCIYDYVNSFDNGKAVVILNNETFNIDKNGNILNNDNRTI